MILACALCETLSFEEFEQSGDVIIILTVVLRMEKQGWKLQSRAKMTVT